MIEYTISLSEHMAMWVTAIGRLVIQCKGCGSSRTFSAPCELGPKRTWNAADKRMLRGLRNFDDSHGFCGGLKDEPRDDDR